MTENELRNIYVKTAKEYAGVQKGSTKHHEIVDIYNTIRPLPQGYSVKYTDAWCATFVSAMAKKCGLLDLIPAECSCPRQITLWQNKGRWQEDDAYVPKAGDIIYYDWQDDGKGDNKGSPDHVGIVCEVSSGAITVIEGAMGSPSKVDYRSIAVNGKYIRGYGIPDYASRADKIEQAPTAKTEVKSEAKATAKKSVDVIAKEVIEGKWGNSTDRKTKLTAAGYDYNAVQAKVNELLKTETKVRVTASALNIRKGPSTNYSVIGVIRDKGVYTIVEEKNGWGRLKKGPIEGSSWISLAYTKKV